jgi:hypothetical protein
VFFILTSYAIRCDRLFFIRELQKKYLSRNSIR